MEEYLPNELPERVYYGTSKYFDNIQRQDVLKLYNAARNSRLHEMREILAIKKMNWYVEKIFELLSKNKCNYDGICIFLDALVLINRNEIKIRMQDCSGKVYEREYSFNYLKYISEPNYLKRDYSDKLLAYTCNLLELYSRYFKKENDFIMFSIYMNGDKWYLGRGFIKWR